MRFLVLAASLAAMPVAIVVAQSDERVGFPSEHWILIQSEIDYLEVAGREIDLALDRATPDQALEKIAATAGLSIEIEGSLPDKPTLTKSFEKATVKEVLTWYAREVPVMYKAKNPGTCVVVARDDVRRDGDGAASRFRGNVE